MGGQLDELILTDDPISSVEEYVARGGGRGLAAARERSPEQVIDAVRLSGLRGRGGAGFPTGI
jgi:formate dehydrogenase iron-sulfur subunit